MKLRILLADDHAVVRDGLRMVLEAQGDIEVVGEAADGRQAVELARRLQPQVAVLDIAMPELNGIEAARQIVEASPATRVVILSMHAGREHIWRALQAGALGYVLKDTAGVEVAQAVRAAHAGQRYLSRRIADVVLEEYVEMRQEAQAGSPLARLSGREREVLQLVVEGRSSAEIAQALALSVKTVETYRSRIMAKLGVKDLPGLVKFAIRQGVITLE